MPPHPRSCPKPTPERKQGEHLTITYLIYSCLIIVLSLSYHCLIIIYLIIVLSLSYHCLILCYCLAVHVDRDWDSTGLRVSAPFPPRLVCRKGRFCLSHIGGRQASKANVSGGSRVNLHRLGTSIVQTWHRSLMNYI